MKTLPNLVETVPKSSLFFLTATVRKRHPNFQAKKLGDEAFELALPGIHLHLAPDFPSHVWLEGKWMKVQPGIPKHLPRAYSIPAIFGSRCCNKDTKSIEIASDIIWLVVWNMFFIYWE